jgi:hypothetical protein
MLMGWYGRQFLELSLGNTVRRICGESIAIEIDTARGGTAKDVERLLVLCSDAWKDIYKARKECPQ